MPLAPLETSLSHATSPFASPPPPLPNLPKYYFALPHHLNETLCSTVHTTCLVHTGWIYRVTFCLSPLPFLPPSFLPLLPLTLPPLSSSPYLIPPLLSSSSLLPSLPLSHPTSSSLTHSFLPYSLLLSRMSPYLMKMFTHLSNREGMKEEVEEEKKTQRNQTMLYLLMLGR